MLIFILLWHMLAYGRLDCSDINDSEVKQQCERGDFSYARGLVYDSSSQDLNMRKWRYKGSRVQWAGNPLVSARCEDNGQPAAITFNNWDEGDNAYSCADNTQLAQPLAEFMDLYLKRCMNEGMRAANLSGTIKTIGINNLGVIAARRVNTGKNGCKGQSLDSGRGGSCSISYHATGRAVDAATFSVTMTDGKSYELPASCTDENGHRRTGFGDGCKREGPMGAFYDKFGECWEAKVKKQKEDCVGIDSVLCKDLKNDCVDQQGVLNCDYNGLHHNHLHLSLPLCPHPRGLSQE